MDGALMGWGAGLRFLCLPCDSADLIAPFSLPSTGAHACMAPVQAV